MDVSQTEVLGAHGINTHSFQLYALKSISSTPFDRNIPDDPNEVYQIFVCTAAKY